MTADEVLAQRILDATNPDMKTQRRFESLFLQFLKYEEKEQGYATGTLQSIFASIRSFFEINYIIRLKSEKTTIQKETQTEQDEQPKKPYLKS